MNLGRTASVLQSFNFAFEGIIHVLRTQRNMRIHFAIAAAVLVAALVIGVGRIELVVLLLAISFVLIAEMLNSALEAGIDVATTSFDPLAKLAKDISAGAVLIATINAVAVGYLVFVNRLKDPSSRVLDNLRDAPAEVTLIALVLTTILVIGAKAYTGRGRPLRGGLPSGHAAIAFAGWMAATYIVGDSTHWFLVSSLTFIMALLVAQTRVEAGIHSLVEVVSGGVLGALGGFKGRKLEAGDELPVGQGKAAKEGRTIAANLRRVNGNPAELRMVPGLYWHRITEAAGKHFFEDTWKVAPEADRIGYRFKGGRSLEFVPRTKQH